MNRKTGGLAAPYRWRVVGADGETLHAPNRGLSRGPAAVYARLSDARRIARTLRRHGHTAAVVPYAKVGTAAVEYANSHDEAWK